MQHATKEARGLDQPERHSHRRRCVVALVAAGTVGTCLSVWRAGPTVVTSVVSAPRDVGFPISPVDCRAAPNDNDPHMTVLAYPSYGGRRAAVDRAWWAPGSKTEVNVSGDLHDQIFHEVLPQELYVDVGANVGQMAMPGLVANKTTYAFDPLAYDVTKLCAGVKENLKRAWATEENAAKVHIFHALVGNESRANVSISRPEAAFGKFEQASVFPQTIGVVRKPKLETEYVPMVTLDAMVPADMPVGLVKIDVQGFELPVVQGMRGLLARTVGFPHIVHYEEQPRVTTLAGFPLGAVQTLLESYGYTCARLDRSDISCKKPRVQGR